MTDINKALKAIQLEAPEECEVIHTLSKTDIAKIKALVVESIGKDEFDQQELDETENGSCVPFMVRNELRGEIRSIFE